jgi:hypothetical protein
MSSSSPPQTPLDCFAQAIKLITLATVIDQRITELVPVFAESFVAVSRSPRARRSSLSMNITSQESVDFPKGTKTVIIILHNKVISVLSVCTADCPHEVSRLIPLVTLHMIPMQQVPESFPSTILVKGKHQTCSSGNNDSNKLVISTLFFLRTPNRVGKSCYHLDRVAVRSRPSKLPAISTPSTIQGFGDKTSKALGARVYPRPNDTIDLMSPPNSPGQESTGDTNNSKSSRRTSMSSSIVKKPRSNLATMGSYSNNGSSQQGSSPSSSVHSLSDSSLQSNASSKRRYREEGNSSMKLGCIPCGIAFGVTKIFLIPRVDNIGDTMSYSIGNLHKYLHGSLHITSNQDQYFKEASAHLEVKVLEKDEQFNDPHNGIHVKYKDTERRGFRGIPHSLAQDIFPLMDLSCSFPRKVASTSIGWSTANEKLYKENWTNIVGSILPFFIKVDIDDLSFNNIIQ